VFKIAAGGKLTTLHSFAGPDGSDPFGLIQATNGDFYGTTAYGAANRTCGRPGCGTIFKITPAGKLTTLYSFCSQTGCTDGSHPSGLIQGVDGNFYGETGSGGIQNYGTLFKITPAGKLTTLHRFSFKDGASPFGLTQATGTILGTLPKP
jgi:uncharacterized repeat protein (TIGR03803 family)